MRKLEEELKRLRMRIPGLTHIGYMREGKLLLLDGKTNGPETIDELRRLFEKSELIVKDLGGGKLKEIYLRGTFCEMVALNMEGEIGFAVVQSSLPLALVLREVKRFFADIPFLQEKEKKEKRANLKEDEIESFLEELTMEGESVEEKSDL